MCAGWRLLVHRPSVEGVNGTSSTRRPRVAAHPPGCRDVRRGSGRRRVRNQLVDVPGVQRSPRNTQKASASLERIEMSMSSWARTPVKPRCSSPDDPPGPVRSQPGEVSTVVGSGRSQPPYHRSNSPAPGPGHAVTCSRRSCAGEHRDRGGDHQRRHEGSIRGADVVGEQPEQRRARRGTRRSVVETALTGGRPATGRRPRRSCRPGSRARRQPPHHDAQRDHDPSRAEDDEQDPGQAGPGTDPEHRRPAVAVQEHQRTGARPSSVTNTV